MKFTSYNPSNIDEIKQLYTKTFTDSESESEGLIVGNLAYELMTSTPAEDLYVFLAIENDVILGSIIFSRLRLANNVNAFLLSPMGVHSSQQGKGIGQKLITFGLDSLKESGVELVFTYGDPNFYAKVGFMPISESIVKAPLPPSFPEGWLGQSLVSDKIEPIAGDSYCVEALNKPEIW